jgi:predicted N-acyltransferase
MEKADRRPSKLITDRSNKVKFKVTPTANGLFNLYQSAGENKWKLLKKGITVLEVMEHQSNIVNNNVLNYINFLSILKQNKNEKALKRNRKVD